MLRFIITCGFASKDKNADGNGGFVSSEVDMLQVLARKEDLYETGHLFYFRKDQGNDVCNAITLLWNMNFKVASRISGFHSPLMH